MTAYSASEAERLVREARRDDGECRCGCRYSEADSLLAIADQLDAARGEVERLEIDRRQLGEIRSKTNEELNRAALYYWEHIDAIATDRGRLAAEVERVRLTAEEREALGELSAAWSRRTWIEGVEWSEIQLAIAALNRLLARKGE